MKKLLIFTITLITSIAGWGQATVLIGGKEFQVRANDDDQTAEIYDPFYVVEETEFVKKNRGRKLPRPNNEQGLLEVPKQVNLFGKTYTLTKIGTCAFADYENLKQIIIPETIEEIGDYAFFRCRLTDVVIPGTVSKIGNRAFGYSKGLKKASIPRNLEFMGQDVFRESKKLQISYIDSKTPVRRKKQVARQSNDPYHVTGLDITSDIDEGIPVNNANNENTFVVVIANENYENVKNVDYALRDGRVFSSYCQMTLGIPSENVHVIENATLNNIINELSWLENIGRVYDGNATMIVYYAGHGIPDETNGSAYLLPVDGVGSNIATGISLKSLYDRLNAIPSTKTLLFLDACFSGAERSGDMLASARGVAIKAKEETPTGHTITFSAASGDETAHALAKQGHGMFTYYLLKKIKESNGKVKLGELADYIKTNVGKRSIVINNKPQTPTTVAAPGVAETWRSFTIY